MNLEKWITVSLAKSLLMSIKEFVCVWVCVEMRGWVVVFFFSEPVIKVL